MITANQVKEAMIKANITEVDDHKCHFCGYMTKFSRHGEVLLFDPGCNCIDYKKGWEVRSWQSIADWINMQDNEEARNKIAGMFGLEL
jgi:hypothetical protein